MLLALWSYLSTECWTAKSTKRATRCGSPQAGCLSPPKAAGGAKMLGVNRALSLAGGQAQQPPAPGLVPPRSQALEEK